MRCRKCGHDLPEREMIMAKVGIEALIDEATKYQEDRPKDDLTKRAKFHATCPNCKRAK